MKHAFAALPLFLGLILGITSHPAVAGLILGANGHRPVSVGHLMELALHHLTLSCLGLALVGTAGGGLGLIATRHRFASFRTGIDTLAAFAQAVPPVVVVALALPILGFGGPPTLLALTAYGIMPALRGTIGALEAVPADMREAARAIGLSPGQILWRVELPLAAEGLVETLRTAYILSVAVTAIGALAGATTLGTPIVAGLQNQNLVALLQGALATASLAFLGDALIQGLGSLVRPDRTAS